MEKELFDFLKLLLPGAMILYASYLMVRAFLGREQQQRHAELEEERVKVTLPLRLQAYERMALFLSRIAPTQLLIRLMQSEMPAVGLQQLLIKEIREEYHHNLSQQIYVSSALWQQIHATTEEIIMLINQAADTLAAEAAASELGRNLLEFQSKQRFDALENTLLSLKEEAHALM